MNIAFVYPECENLGIGYLSACLKKGGHSTKLIFDPMLFGSYYLKSNCLKRVFSYKEKVINEIVKSKYDLVCFSVFSDYYGWAGEIAQEIKNRNSDIPIIFGGIHPSSVPEYVIRENFVDYVCVGEGEEAIVELAGCLEKGGDIKGIKNIWSKENGRIMQNEVRPLIQELDNLPLPDKGIFAREFNNFVQSVYTIITSRGCPNACTYCYNSHLKSIYSGKGKYLRRRSVDNVIDELSYAKKQYNIKRVSFFDDLFIFDPDWLEDFTEKYATNIHLPYFCHVHPAYINEKVVNLLKKSGCSTVTMGIQTIDEKIRKEVLARSETNEQIIQAVELLKKAGIFLFTNIIFGLPLQDESVMVEDIKFANRFRVDIPASNWLRYYPRTRIVQIANELSLLGKDKIRAIEGSKEYAPYSIKGNTYTKLGARLRNLLLLSHLLPKRTVDYILERKLYKLIPTINIRFYIEALIIEYNIFLSKKKFPFAYLSLKDVIKYYFYYMKRKLC